MKLNYRCPYRNSYFCVFGRSLAVLKSKKARSMVKTSILQVTSESTDLSGDKDLAKNSNKVPVTAYYDAENQLVEIAIIGSTVAITRQIIQAFSLSVPYHTSVRRFTFRRSGLTAELIYEVNKLLPISNISEICFDDSYVQEGNYYILLEQYSQLKYLSLNRCQINDEICKKIFANIKFDSPAANTLRILELGSNNITDDGAEFIGSVLKANRCLLHLNLSENKITDGGFMRILDSLMEFPLDYEVIMKMRRRKVSYIQSKLAVYTRCLNDLKCRETIIDDMDSGTKTSHAKRLWCKRNHMKKQKSEYYTLEEEAEIMTREIIGEFHDPFSANYVNIKNGLTYSKGNFVLCSLNIAYNDLHYPSVRKLSKLLRYQHEIFKAGKDTGLIRVTLDGNNIPKTCPEFDYVSFYLKNVIALRQCNKVKSIFIRGKKNKD